MHTLDDLAHLSDADLLAGLQRVLASERHAIAQMVAYLAELDKRRLYLALGFTSLFRFCTDALHLSEDATCNRIEVARAARRHPVVLGHLASGDLSLTAIRLLAPHLTSENHQTLLAEARHKGLDEIRYLIARYKPQPPVPSTIRKTPVPKAATIAPDATDAPSGLLSAPAAARSPSPSSSPAKRAVVAPLSEETYRVQVTIRKSAHDKLRCIQDLLRHQVPNGDPAAIFERALDVLYEDLLKKKAAVVDRPRPAREQAPKGRHVPADVRRKVWTRDAGRCAFKSSDGRRCSETGCLEYHHVVPFAAGGKTTVDNIEMRCRAHNDYEAERYFGADVMSLFRERPPAYQGAGASRSSRD
jgi:hypothetical protein